ncbi:DUF305 domain-containing protein [Dactylosporangium vinaceum]|uniref:DUF305 domain-containing protein n=1 Tax=Dactylosporangium vinaceum TaxID=53362 RepID=A0ABV5MAI7_9ACTN|nr:DUF305 domain-containing protein [Dactylosporangium vinaceum]UAB92963.1 DUF305 domain-containing protein [Dactylosporangium vinaceum]
MQRTLVRRATLAGAALTTALLLAACGDHGSMPGMEHGSGTTTAVGSASPGAAAFNAADVMFAQMMIPHHRQAVQMAALAGTRAADAEVKTLAGQIKAAQDPEIQTMTGWLSTWGRPAPAMSGMDMGGMGHAMPGMMSDADLAKLEAATGKDFDKQFCTMMIAHHQGAIAMAQDEIKQGSNPDAKALAQRIVTAQQAEIDTMNTILARL